MHDQVGPPSMSHQAGQSHLRALAVQFAQLLHNLRQRPRWAVLKRWAIAEQMVSEVGGWVVSKVSCHVRVLLATGYAQHCLVAASFADPMTSPPVLGTFPSMGRQ
jgi:hypothetical protein